MNEGLKLFQEQRKPWICILGFAGSKKHAPFADERWNIWGVNDLYAYVPRVDVTFEVHHTLNMGARRNPEHEAVMRAGGRRGSQYKAGEPRTPIVMQSEHPNYPTVFPYPLDTVITEFGRKPFEPVCEAESAVAPGASYFTNSIGLMLAMAILELTEVKKINGRDMRVAKADARLGVVGISMAAESEYIAQRPNVEYWIGRAQGYGIDVWVPDDAHILKAATMYGYASSSPLAVRLQSDKEDMKQKTIELQQAEAQINAQAQQVQLEIAGVRAVKQYQDMLLRTMTIDTEIGVGSDQKGPGVGRDAILTLQDGKVIEASIVAASDNHQPAGVH